LDFTGSNITSIENRSHQDLQNLQGGAFHESYHLSLQDYNRLKSGTAGPAGRDGEDGEDSFIYLIQPASSAPVVVGSGLTHPEVLTRISFRM
jgi:hypothetical protein